MTLLELYRIAEMARTRGDAAWSVLDWAAKQQGDFTIRDAYRVYAAAGGESTEQQFATIFNKWVAKYDPASSKDRYRDREAYGLSQSRPLIITRSGKRGKGGAATYQWGLDGPLRQAPTGEPAPEVQDDAVGEALDKLEGYMGGIELRKRMKAWQGMTSMEAVMRDVMTLPARMRAEAMLVASQHLIRSGEATQGQVDDMETKLASRAPQAPTGTPFKPGAPRQGLPQDGRPGFRQRPAPQPEPEEPVAPEQEPDDDPAADWQDDDPADRTDPDAASPFADDAASDQAPGDDDGMVGTPEGTCLEAILRARETGGMSRGSVTWENGEAVVRDASGRVIRPHPGIELQVLGDEQFDEMHADLVEALADAWPDGLLDLPDAGGPDLEAEMGGPGTGGEEDGGEGEGEEEPEQSADYPPWTPAPDPEGSPPEQAMTRLVNDHGIGPDDPLWDAVTHASDQAELRRIVMKAWAGRPKQGFRDAITVASFGLDNAFETPEEYEDESDAEQDVESEPEVDDDVPPEEPDAEEGPAPEAAAIPGWLPQPDEDGTRAEAAMNDILTEMPNAAGFEGFDASHPLFAELRAADDINDAFTVLSRASVPRIMVRKFLAVTRAVFEHDGRDPETGQPVTEGVSLDGGDDCELDPTPEPSRRGRVGVGRLLPMYGMDEGPNTEPVDFAPKSGLARIMRLARGR